MKKVFCIIISLAFLFLTFIKKSVDNKPKVDNSVKPNYSIDHGQDSEYLKNDGFEITSEISSSVDNYDDQRSSDTSNLCDNSQNIISEEPFSDIGNSLYVSPPGESNNDGPPLIVETVSDVAGEKDETAIADRIIVYLNDYRSMVGSCHLQKLPRLTEYAKYRSHQLTSNFAHDTNDERSAATALKYGKYIDPSEFGMTGEPYYSAYTSEAIANSGFSGNVDTVAKRFAEMCRNSPDHWSYIGNSNYSYVGVGVTYYYGFWYVDISLTGTTDFEK